MSYVSSSNMIPGKRQMNKNEQIIMLKENEKERKYSVKIITEETNLHVSRKPPSSSSRKIKNDDALLFSTRRSRRYKPVDIFRDLIVLMPNIDARKRMGVGTLESEDFLRCMDDVVEYEEDSDGDVQPIAYISLPTSVLNDKSKETISAGSNTNKVVHIPRVTLSSDDLRRPLSTPRGTETTLSSSPGYRIASINDVSELSVHGSERSAFPSFSDDQDYDCDTEDEVFIQLCNSVGICRATSLSLTQSHVMTETVLEQLVASLEQQLEWAYDNIEASGSAHSTVNTCEEKLSDVTGWVQSLNQCFDPESVPDISLLNEMLSENLTYSGSQAPELTMAHFTDLFVGDMPMENPYLPSSWAGARSLSRKMSRGRQAVLPTPKQSDAVQTHSEATSYESTPRNPNEDIFSSGRALASNSIKNARDKLQALLPLSKAHPVLLELFRFYSPLKSIQCEVSPTPTLNSTAVESYLDTLRPHNLVCVELEASIQSPIDLSVDHYLATLVYWYWVSKRSLQRTSLIRSYQRFSMRNWSRSMPRYPYVPLCRVKHLAGVNAVRSVGESEPSRPQTLDSLEEEANGLEQLRWDLEHVRTIVDRVRRREKVKRDYFRVTGTCLSGDDLSSDCYAKHSTKLSHESPLRAITSKKIFYDSEPRRVGRPRKTSSNMDTSDVDVATVSRRKSFDFGGSSILAQRESEKKRKRRESISIVKSSEPGAVSKKDMILWLTDKILLTGVALYGIGRWMEIKSRFGSALSNLRAGLIALRFSVLCRRRKENQPLDSSDLLNTAWAESDFFNTLNQEERLIVHTFDEEKIWEAIFVRYLSEETRKSAVSTLLNMKKHSPSVMELVPDHLRGGNWAKYMHTLLDPATSPPYHSVITERRDINFSGKKSSQNKIGSDEDESDAAILDPAFVPLRLRLLSRTSLSSVAHKTTPTPILEDEDTKSSDVDIERLLQHAGSNSDTEFDGEDDEDDDNNNQDEEDSGEGEGDGDGDDDYSNSDEDEESIATAPQLGNCADNVQIELSSDYAFEDDAGSGDTTDAASSESLMARVGNEAPLSINSISAKQSEAVVSRRSVDSNQLMTLADTKTPSTSATAVPRRSRCLNAPTGLLLQIGASQQKPMLSHIKPAYDMNLPRLSHEDRIAPSPNGRGLFGRLSTSPMQSSILQAPRLKSSKISISPVNSSSSSSPHVDWQTGSDHKRTRDAIEELMMNTTDGFGSVKHTTSTVATNAQTFQRRRSQNNRLCGLTIDTDDN